MDLQDFASRVRTMAPRLHRIAYLILRNEADCEDVTQEALLRAWQRIHSLRDEHYFETWLIRILINECKRLIHHNAKARPATPASGEARVVDDTDLHDALLALDANYRVVIALHHIEGYSLEEIARMQGIPTTTVKWRLYQGRKLLKRQLSGEEAKT